MTNQSRNIWIGGVIAAFVAMSATAGPPIFHDQNRNFGNSLGAGRCEPIPNGYRCVDVSAWENYDVKGGFQFTEAAISFNVHRDFGDGSWMDAYRYLVCPVDQKAISVLPNSASLEATLDPSAPGCYSDGQRVTWDPINGYQFFPYGYPGPRKVSGEWLDPTAYSNSVSNRRDKFHDGWTDTTSTMVINCKESYGDLMKNGGFSIDNFDSIVFFPFEGIDTPGWSYYQTMSCNDNNMQK